QSKNNSVPDFYGTYELAKTNISIDYLAIEIENMSRQTKKQNLTVLIGNDTCQSGRICNGPLRSNTVYKVLIGGCTSSNLVDCTYVLSTAFKTMSPITGKIGHFIL
ncbi:unnamed protein product, partial [Didymodactylos carnosus]